jgi:hypothetical protein
MGGRHSVMATFLASLAFLTYLYGIIAVNAGDLPQLKVTAEPRLGYAPGHVIVTVYAKPDAQNRYFALSVGSNDSAFAASSQRRLDGEDEPGQLARVTYRDVPPGNYLVVATLFDRSGKQLASRSVDVTKLPR